MKKEEDKNNRGSGQTDRSGMEAEFSRVVESIKSCLTGDVHPEANFLHRYSWEGMLTIRFEAGKASKDTDWGQQLRSDFVRALMNNICRKWGVRGREIQWVAATEFGESGTPHLHVCFSFHKLVELGKKLPDLNGFSDEAKESCEFIRVRKKIPSGSVGLHWLPAEDDFQLINYLCKVEPGREYKHFDWSHTGRKAYLFFEDTSWESAISEIDQEGKGAA